MPNPLLGQTLLTQRCSLPDRSLGKIMKTLTAFSISLFLGISGCVIQRAQIASRAQTELVGMSKKDLLLCAGVPLRQERVEDLEFLTFAGGGDSIGSAVASSTSLNTATVVGKSARRYCEATFVLKDGLVQKVNYQGRTGGLLTKGEQCAFIVENCVR
jgi:hypothetical protein